MIVICVQLNMRNLPECRTMILNLSLLSDPVTHWIAWSLHKQNVGGSSPTVGKVFFILLFSVASHSSMLE